MNMLLWLWLITLLAAGGMLGLAVVRPRLKIGWWIATGTGLLVVLLWAAAYPTQERTLLWPGHWQPLLPPPGSYLTPWHWAVGLLWLLAAWAGLALTVRLSAPPLATPWPWLIWLGSSVLGVTLLSSGMGWSLALAWVAADILSLLLEHTTAPSEAARRAIWRRTGMRALTWGWPVAYFALPTAWHTPTWAGAALLRAWFTPRPQQTGASIFGSTGRWVFWLPWLVTLAPLLRIHWQPLPPSMGMLVTAIGLWAAWRGRHRQPLGARWRGWMTAGAALVLLAAPHSPQAAQVWLLLLTTGGFVLDALLLATPTKLSPLPAVLLAGPALLWPFTPGARTLAAWHWPPSGDTLAQAILAGALLALAGRLWPRGQATGEARGALMLTAAGLLLLPTGLWGLALRLGWLTPPPNLAGWLPWGAGPIIAALAAGLNWLGARSRVVPALRRWAGLPRPEEVGALLGRVIVRGIEESVLFLTALLEGEGGWFWALVALALAWLAWQGKG